MFKEVIYNTGLELKLNFKFNQFKVNSMVAIQYFSGNVFFDYFFMKYKFQLIKLNKIVEYLNVFTRHSNYNKYNLEIISFLRKLLGSIKVSVGLINKLQKTLKSRIEMNHTISQRF
jgi:hypothetical protein